MDPSRFDAMTRVIARTGTRRWLLPRVAAASVLGALLSGDAEVAGAERPSDRIRRRSKQRNRKQRNKRRKHQNAGNGGGNKDGATPSGCTKNGEICANDGDCCSNNCFNYQCAAGVNQCGQGSARQQCTPVAKGCAGANCCYGSVACGDTCCDASATGCSDQTGQCEDGTPCNAQTCPHGCCDAATGQCVPGADANQACGKDGQQCVACPSATQCVQGECRCTDESCPPSSGRTCQENQCICTDVVCQGCCLDNVCHPGDQPEACAPGGDCAVCQPEWICFGTARVCCPPDTTHLCGAPNFCCSSGCCGDGCC